MAPTMEPTDSPTRVPENKPTRTPGRRPSPTATAEPYGSLVLRSFTEESINEAFAVGVQSMPEEVMMRDITRFRIFSVRFPWRRLRFFPPEDLPEAPAVGVQLWPIREDAVSPLFSMLEDGEGT